MNHEHHKKIKIFIYAFSFIILVGAIYYVSLSISNTSAKLTQCRELFDSKELENKKKICCDESHYNSPDELCKAKCDTLNVAPGSSFCTEIALKQEQPAKTTQITKPKTLTKLPECRAIGVEPNLEKDGDKFVLKAGKPLRLNYQIYSPEVKARSYVYEFFSYEDGKNNFKALSFESGKSYIGFYNASDLGKVNQSNEVLAFHEDLYKPDLNNNSEYPKNVLMTLSIIDNNNMRKLQNWNCFIKLKIDQTPNYCKSIAISDKEISKGESTKITVTPNTVNVNNYDFRIINKDNDNEEVRFESPINSFVSGNNNTRVIIKGNKENPVNLNLSWSQLYKKDENTGNYPKNLKIKAFVRPLENVSSDDVASCSVDLKINPDEGVRLCDDLSLSLNRRSGDVNKGIPADADGKYTMKSTDFINITAKAKNSDIKQFIFTFHNLDNRIEKDYGKGKGYTKEGIKNAYPINFKKNVDLEVTKTANATSAYKTFQIYHEDFDTIDLLTGSRPKNVQVRAYFVNSKNEISNLDSDCIREFRIE